MTTSFRSLLLSFCFLYIADTEGKLVSWKNDQIEAIRTSAPKIGEPLIIAARHREEFERGSCDFRTPSLNVVYTVTEGTVYDENGTAVDGIEAWDDSGDPTVCGIKILAMDSVHDEDSDVTKDGWVITLRFPQGGILGIEKLDKIQVEIHLKEDVMKYTLEPRFGHTPEHYDLSLVPDLMSTSKAVHFTGSVKMTLRTTSYPGFIIPVQMSGLDIRRLNGTATRQSTGTTEPLGFHMIYFSLQEDLVILFALNPLFEIGDVIEPEIDFEGSSHQERSWGLFKERCNSNSDKFCWFTQFEANGARYAFPCHDEPEAKATFDIKVARTEGWKTLGNMPIIRSEPVEDMNGWVWDIFETTPTMSSYLIAFAIQDYESVSGSGNVTVWATKEYIDAGYADYAKEVGPASLEFMGETFGINYSLPKMDMVNVPHFLAGGMENWGLVLYEFDYLLFDPSNTDEDTKYNVIEYSSFEIKC